MLARPVTITPALRSLGKRAGGSKAWIATCRSLSAFTLTMAVACTPTDFSVESASCPICTPDEIARWERVRDHSAGIAGKDLVGHVIGFSPARKSFGGDIKWEPLLPEKTIMCGTLEEFGFHDGSGDESDWLLNIVPAAGPSADLFAIMVPGVEDSELECAEGNCVHAEIDPDQSFLSNDFFWVEPDEDSRLKGEALCTYGAFVGDQNHGMKIEIHPAEMLWWKSVERPLTDSIVYMHLLQLQDDSDRFHRFDFFAPGEPNLSAPWAQVPRKGEFSIAFEADPTGSRVRTYSISEIYERRVVTKDHSELRKDADDGSEHRLLYDGVPVVTAKEEDVDENIGVRFIDICREGGTNRLLGYLSLRSGISTDAEGGEGYHMLVVIEKNKETAAADPAFLRAVSQFRDMKRKYGPDPRVEIIARKLGRIPPRPVPILSADFVLQTEGAKMPLEEIKSATITSADGRSEQFALVPEGGQTSLVAANVPVTRGSTATIEFSSGQREQLRVAGLGMAPHVRHELPQEAQPDPRAWNTVVAAVGATNARPSASATLVRATRWAVEIAPRYAPLRDGRPSGEDESSVAHLLNTAIDSAYSSLSFSGLNPLFGSREPFTVLWEFRGTDLRTGRSIPTGFERNARDAEIQVERSGGRFAGTRLQIQFANEGVYRLDLTARIQDEYGTRGELRRTVWSHYLRPTAGDTSSTSFVRLVADLVGVSADSLLDASGPANRPRSVSAEDRARGHQLITGLSIRAGRDHRIVLGELAQLISVSGRALSLRSAER